MLLLASKREQLPGFFRTWVQVSSELGFPAEDLGFGPFSATFWASGPEHAHNEQPMGRFRSNSCLDGNDPDKNSLSEKLKGQEQPSFLPFLARADRRADSNDIRAQAPDATSDKRERTDWTGNVKSYDI